MENRLQEISKGTSVMVEKGYLIIRSPIKSNGTLAKIVKINLFWTLEINQWHKTIQGVFIQGKHLGLIGQWGLWYSNLAYSQHSLPSSAIALKTNSLTNTVAMETSSVGSSNGILGNIYLTQSKTAVEE